MTPAVWGAAAGRAAALSKCVAARAGQSGQATVIARRARRGSDYLYQAPLMLALERRSHRHADEGRLVLRYAKSASVAVPLIRN
jgi:hypothetical protein